MKRNKDTPPALAVWILSRITRGKERLSVLSDFSEIYEELASEEGSFKARKWYWNQVLRSIPMFILNHIYWRAVMFKNYFKIALQNIKMHKINSIIHVFGLALGFTCCILIYLYVSNELSYDKFHENRDSLYRVVIKWHNPDGSVGGSQSEIPPGVGNLIFDNFPEIECYSRYDNRDGVVQYKDKIFAERIWMTETPFFKMFTFPLTLGEPEKVLSQNNAVLLTRSYAEKYFGTENPIGKIITIIFGQNKMDFSVAGIVEDLPLNSSLKFDILINMSNFPSSYLTSLRSFSTELYIQLRRNVSPEVIEQKFPEFYDNHFQSLTQEWKSAGIWKGEGRMFSFALQNIKDIHLDPELGGVSPKASFILSGIALIILIIACFNFMNISMGMSFVRSKEIGMRKVFGARKGQIIRQFWSESLVISFISMGIGILFAGMLLPTFSNFTGKPFNINSMINILNMPAFLVIPVLTGIFSGSYPALILANFNLAEIMKGKLRSGSKRYFTKTLVIIQFSLSIFLITSAIISGKQLDFLIHRNPGFETEGILAILIQEREKSENLRVANLFREKSKLHNKDLSVANKLFGRGASYDGVKIDGKMHRVYDCEVDYNFFDMFGLEIIEGRSFVKEIASDERAAIVNQAFVKECGLISPIGKNLNIGSFGNLSIIGVIRDFNFRSLKHEIEPAIFHLQQRRGFKYILAKISSTNVPETISFFKKTWKEIQPDKPFIYYFQDEVLENQYNSEKSWNAIVRISSIFAIFIACMGIFGLSSITINRRVKEIGIRKVLGAKISQILNLILKDFIILVVIANIIAWPVIYFVMRNILQNYAYRINIGIHYFIIAGAATVMIAILTIIYIAIKAAVSNPADAIRNE